MRYDPIMVLWICGPCMGYGLRDTICGRDAGEENGGKMEEYLANKQAPASTNIFDRIMAIQYIIMG